MNQDANNDELLLNSDRIKAKFGSYGIDVLQDQDRIRVSSLYSVHDEQKVTRTFSVVHSPAVVDALFAEEYQEIVAGQSIGALFRRKGWHIEKHPMFLGEISASEDYASVYQLMGGVTPTPLAIHVYTLSVEKNRAKFRYGALAEVHHPEYLNLSELKEAYGRGYIRRYSRHIDKFLDVVKDRMRQV